MPDTGTRNAKRDVYSREPRTVSETRMAFSFSIGPLVALIAGILILLIPRLLNYIIALYLIIIGVLGLLGPGAGVRADATDGPPSAVHSVVQEPVGRTTGI
ncbi:MAG: hypothetical protein JWO70_673 [Betaproteobacteria bacterium]|jgi:hypothetical protein|nr:hypothetical protein [Betaproteobacteria bacterium]